MTATPPEKTEEPFHLSYTYTRKEYADWEHHRIHVPTPYVSVPVPDEDAIPEGPIWFGALSEVDFHSQVELPKGYRPDLPSAVHLKEAFAQYDATYEFKDGKIFAQRHLKTLMREVPATERAKMEKFAKTVREDRGEYIQLNNENGDSRPQGGHAEIGTLTELRDMPGSSNEEAMRLEQEARDAGGKKDMQGVITALYRAVSADPKFTRAWVGLGSLLISQKQFDAGIDAFHKAMALDPERAAIPKELGFGLIRSGRFEDALPLWRDFVKAHPDDADGQISLGACLYELRKYGEAAATYEAAVKLREKRTDLRVRLASAYVRAGDREKAGATFLKIKDLNPDREVLNDVAYEMAEQDVVLPQALEFAKKASGELEKESVKITLASLTLDDLRMTQQLAAYWDTVGWVNSRMSHFEEAEQYLQAAWMLTQDGMVANHLCVLQDRLQKPAAAIEMCGLAVNRLPMSEGVPLNEAAKAMDETRRRLDFMKTKAPKSKTSTDPSDVVIRQRTFKMPRFLPGTESAEFFLLLSSDGKTKTFKVDDVRFISGSEKMKLQGKQLKTVLWNFSAPAGVSARFVRRGILGCYESSGCSFVLLDQASVRSLN